MPEMSFLEASGFSTAPDSRGGQFLGNVPEGWDIAGAVNGGFLLATCARAICEVTEKPDILTITGHYLAPASAGPFRIEATMERSGGRHSTARALLSNESGALLSCIGTATDLSAAEGPQLVTGEPAHLPDPEDCTPVTPGDPFPPPFMGRIDLRLVPEDARFYEGDPTGEAKVRGWFRLRDDEVPDSLALVLATDSFPPTIFNAALPLAWTPTIELTAHVRGLPPPAGEWMGCSFETRFITGGYLEADGEIWNRDGTLLAQSRQLALTPRG